jgi:hypothetical protein
LVQAVLARIDESNTRSYPGRVRSERAVARALDAGVPAHPRAGSEVTTLARSALARERTLPVVDPFVPLLPDGGLVRGKALSCHGAASMSLAVALAVRATATGSWLAVVDVPTFGLEAAEEFGIPLERVVRVDPPPRTAASTGAADAWAELVSAVVDGFEIVITRVPRRLNGGLARRVQSRLRARETVLIALAGGFGSGFDPGSFPVDTELVAADPRWEGVADGWGHLRGRRVAVSSSGRRVPQPRSATLWLPGPDGKVATVEPDAASDRTGRPDATAEW